MIQKIVAFLAAFLLIAQFGATTFAQPAAEPQAAAPMSQDDLPDLLLQGDMLGVAVFDLKTGDKTAWNNAWMVISGGKPTTRPLGPDDPLPIGVEQALGPLFKMGVDSFAYGVSMRNSMIVITFGVRLKDGANEKDANAWFNKTIRGGSPIKHVGPWMVKWINTQNGSAETPLPPSSQADVIREALNCRGADVPIRIVWVSSEPIKKQILKAGPPPEELAPLTNLYWNMKYLYTGVWLGAQPQIEARWVAPDADGADAVIKEFTTLRQKLKAPNNGLGLPPFFGTMMDQCQPVREENVARVSLGQKELANIFAAVLAFSMNPQNNGGQVSAQQSSVAANWKPTDPAVDSASAQMRLILSAIVEYDHEHQTLPASLDDLVTDKLVPGAEVFHDPITGKDAGFIYTKPDGVTKLADITTPAKTGILFEEKEGQADQAGLIGYADGHVGGGK